MKLYKYHGAGNDFLIIDQRQEAQELTKHDIIHLCDRHTGFGSDGLMTVGQGEGQAAFKMQFFNPDGTSGMMCGNGGRCISAFVAQSGEFKDKHFLFQAPDGIHESWIVQNDPATHTQIVRLKMADVTEVKSYGDSCYFINTGARHFVCPVDDVDRTDVVAHGRAYRYHDPRFQPEGVNVDFVHPEADGLLQVRTYEKGVEDETLACGTGIVATALAAHLMGVKPESTEGLSVTYAVQARISRLTVEFEPVPHAESGTPAFRNIYLTGPATLVGEIEV